MCAGGGSGMKWTLSMFCGRIGRTSFIYPGYCDEGEFQSIVLPQWVADECACLLGWTH